MIVSMKIFRCICLINPDATLRRACEYVGFELFNARSNIGSFGFRNQSGFPLILLPRGMGITVNDNVGLARFRADVDRRSDCHDFFPVAVIVIEFPSIALANILLRCGGPRDIRVKEIHYPAFGCEPKAIRYIKGQRERGHSLFFVFVSRASAVEGGPGPQTSKSGSCAYRA